MFLSLLTTGIFAQNPILTWRFNNAQVIAGDSMRFDIELKCSFGGTYHSSTQIYWVYNTQAFGPNIVANNKARFEKLALLSGEAFGSPKYIINNMIDNNDSTLAILFEASFLISGSTFMNEVTTDFQGFGRFTVAIADMGENAGIHFLPSFFGVGMMNGGQYYLDATHPNETKYGDPPDYAGIYENDLVGFQFFQVGTIAGTVVDQNTVPIAGATVTAGTYSTTTLGDGTYSMTVQQGTYDVTASANCYGSSTVNGVVVTMGVTTTVDFTLTGNPLGEVSGLVTDFVTLLPVGGVTVTAGAYSTTTLGDGTYVLANVTPDVYDIAFTHPDYFPYTAMNVSVLCNMVTTVNATIIPTSSAGTITGVVTDAVTTLPLADVMITAGSFSTLTALDGSYSLFVPAATYDVIATKVCYQTQTQTAIVPVGGTVTLDFALTPMGEGTLQGYVYDDITTLGIANATVTAGTGLATTDITGFYTMVLNEGTYDVTATHPNYQSGTVSGVTVLCGQTTNQNIGLHPTNPPNPVLTWQFSNVSFDADSVYFDVELKCSFPGTYHSSTQVYCDYNSLAFGENIVGNGKIKYTKLALLSGEVSPGNPKYEVMNFVDNTSSRFAIIMEAPVVNPNPMFMNEVTMSFQGFLHFAIKIESPYYQANIAFVPSIPPNTGLMNGGQWYVDAYHPDETKYGDPPVYAGIYSDPINIVPTLSGVLQGNIMADVAGGTPIPGALITAVGPIMTYTTYSNATGFYQLFLPVGTYTVTVTKDCYAPKTAPGMVIQANITKVQNFALQSTPNGVLHGKVTDAQNAQPIANASVSANPGGFVTTTNSAGNYTFSAVPPGTYTLTFSATGYNGGTLTGISVSCGQTVIANIALQPMAGSMTGTVTNLGTGAPLGGATITMTPGGYTGPSQSNGTYNITGVPPGTYTAVATLTGYISDQHTSIHVYAGQPTTVNFQLEQLVAPSNVQASVANCNDVTITWTGAEDAKDLLGYNVYRDGAVIQYTGYTHYTDWNAPAGTHTYCVTAVYSGGVQSSQACAPAVTTDNCAPPQNLTYTTTNGGASIKLNWQAPTGDGEWIHWDNGSNYTTVGLGNGGTFYAASRWLPEDLAQYDGLYLTSVRFYANDAASDVVVYVWQGANAGQQLYEQNVTSLLADWNDITLTNPVTIDATSELWIGYKITHAAGTNPAGCDEGPAIAGKGDMISTDGTTWQSMSQAYSLDYNWNIEGFVTSLPDGSLPAQPMAKTMVPVQNSGWLVEKVNPDPKPVDGEKALLRYAIYHHLIGGTYTKLDSVPAGTLTYTHANALNTGFYHWYYVIARYTTGSSTNSNVVFVNLLSVPEEITGEFRVYPNPATDMVNIESATGIEEIILSNPVGEIVQKLVVSKENLVQMNISNLAMGVYNLRVRTAEGVATVKLVVK